MKILLTGFFGEGNLGDESILKAIFANIGSEHQLALTCGRQPSISGPKFLPRRGLRAWPDFLRQISNCDKAVFSGGILQDWSFEGITFFALRILAASIFNAPPALWGAGIGPIRRKSALRIAAKALKRVKTAWLRDMPSLALFEEVSGNNGNEGTDWTWHFDLAEASRPFANGPLGLNLRNWPYSDWQKTVETQMKHVDRHVIGIAARNSDLQTIKQFAARATLMAPASFEELGNICSGLSYGIAMRYHVALAMLRCGVPVKLLAYDDKVLNLATDADVELLSHNSLAGFKVARPGFITENKARFDTMKQAFKQYLDQR